MVTKRIRSEYMKKFKDPKWESYTKCYEEMLKYRLTRRLLEHTHNPWFWNGSDSDSESGGISPPPPGKNRVQGETTGAELEVCEGTRGADQRPRDVPRLPLLEEEVKEGVHGSQKGAQEEREAQAACSNRGSKHVTLAQREEPERGPAGSRPLQTKPSKLSKKVRHLQRVRPVVTRPPREDGKDKHPFALYGSGEKHADIAGRKTHNVRPAASTNEIYESALRAKTRREVERQIQTQRTERRRAKSVDLGKTRKVVQPEFNPWLTEYMRCFSARSR